MKIIILSDLNWEQHLRSVSLFEAIDTPLERIGIPRYDSISRYLNIVLVEKAHLVLIAGDVTGDGSCGHGFQNAFLLFLSMLEKLKIPSCFISGNHDEIGYYKELETNIENLEYTNEISNKVININGLKILGVPYETTYSKSKIKKLLTTFDNQYDIVLAHSQLKRRISLFKLKAKYIFTGHYDRKLFGFQDSVFVSLDNDMTDISYSTLELKGNSESISIDIQRQDGVQFKLVETTRGLLTGIRNASLFMNGSPKIDLNTLENHPESTLTDASNKDLTYLKYIRGTQYKSVLERMVEIELDPELKPTLTVAKGIIRKQITANYAISESLVIDYLGKRSR